MILLAVVVRLVGGVKGLRWWHLLTSLDYLPLLKLEAALDGRKPDDSTFEDIKYSTYVI